MDISSNQQKNMKAKELRNVIREAILEVLNEGLAYTITYTTGKKETRTFANQAEADAFKKNSSGNVKSVINAANPTAESLNKLEEDELDEANVGGKFELAPDVDVESFTGKKKRIIAAMQDSGEAMTKAGVAIALGYTKTNSRGQTVAKQQPIDSEFNELVRSGAIVSAGEQAAPRFSRPQPAPGEEGEEPEDTSPWGGEEFLIGPYMNIGKSTPASTSDEDEEEPVIEPEKIEKVGPVSPLSPEDSKAADTYADLKFRLERTKSNLTKEKRSTGGGEFMGNQSKADRIKALESTKKGLEDRIAALVAGSKYLQDKIAKEQTGKASKAPKLPEIEPVEDEDEDIVAENYEYERRQLQYRAGIIR